MVFWGGGGGGWGAGGFWGVVRGRRAAEMRNAAFLRVTEESGRCGMREYGRVAAMLYAGI